jgi:hypothetical protein
MVCLKFRAKTAKSSASAASPLGRAPVPSTHRITSSFNASTIMDALAFLISLALGIRFAC